MSLTAVTAAGAGERAVATRSPASIGAPWFGGLGDGAVRLPAGPGYTIRRPERAWGTPAAVRHTREVLARMYVEFPRAHVLAVGDISQRTGTKITLHRSHQSGRDVDLGFYYRAKPPNYPQEFVDANADNLDRPRTWALLMALLALRDAPGGVQVVFVDYQVQRWLFEYGEAIGMPVAWLYETFQYPRGQGAPGAIVRHIPNHLDHFHVRFQCEPADDFCE